MPVGDKYNRCIKDLRISVTDRCNFRCHYCMPEDIFGHKYQFLNRDKILTFEEITSLAKLFASLGVTKLRLTGGEPLLRHELYKLITKLNEIDGIEDIALTTNGYLLEKYGARIKEAGLKRLTISLDTLNPDLFPKLAGKHLSLEHVIQGIEYAMTLGFSVIKLNSVIQKNVNENEILDLLNFATSRSLIIRFIEYMDVGNLNGWKMDEVVTAAEIISKLSSKHNIEAVGKNYWGEVANRYRFRDGSGEFGIIASVTQPFCGSCTRARISADGKLFTCLFGSEGKDLKTLIRSGTTDEELLRILRSVWEKRGDRYSEERAHSGKNNVKKVEMYQIGG